MENKISTYFRVSISGYVSNFNPPAIWLTVLSILTTFGTLLIKTTINPMLNIIGRNKEKIKYLTEV